MVLDVDFMVLNILKLDILHIPWIHYKLEEPLQKIVEKHQFSVILILF